MARREIKAMLKNGISPKPLPRIQTVLWTEADTFEFLGLLRAIAPLLASLAVLTLPLAFLLAPFPDFDTSPRYHSRPFCAGEPLKDLAGDYDDGRGRGVGLLSILSDGRYSFVSSGCTGIHHRESEYAQKRHGRMVLTPVKLPLFQRLSFRSIFNAPFSAPSSGRHIDRDFLPVGWGASWYLVPADGLREFCDWIIAGWLPGPRGHGSILRSAKARGTEQFHGLPDLPEEWLEYLRDKVVFGRVLEVEDDSVPIGLGSTDGVRIGSFLVLEGVGMLMAGELEVVDVRARTCTALERLPGASDQPIEIGQEVIYERDHGQALRGLDWPSDEPPVDRKPDQDNHEAREGFDRGLLEHAAGKEQ
jgi:hypothetical protein